MIVTFEEEYLKQLYELGNSGDKRHRYQPNIVKGYQKAVKFLLGASSIESLWTIKSLHYEELIGDKAGLSSVRVNNKYRIEFTVNRNFEQPALTICNIVELSNHHK